MTRAAKLPPFTRPPPTRAFRHRAKLLWEIRQGLDRVVAADYLDRFGLVATIDDETSVRIHLPNDRVSWKLGPSPGQGEDRIIHWVRWMPDGWILTVSSSAGPDRTPAQWWNAKLWTRSGSLVRELNLDSEISKVFVAGNGGIWIGYADTGIFGGRGTGDLAAQALVCFDDKGKPTFRLASQDDGSVGLACPYSIAPAENGGVWLWSYSHFRLVHIDAGGKIMKVIETPKFLHGGAPVLVRGKYGFFSRSWEGDEAQDAWDEADLTPAQEAIYDREMERRETHPRFYVWPLDGSAKDIRRLKIPGGRYHPVAWGQEFQILDVQEHAVFGISLEEPRRKGRVRRG